MFLAEPPPSRYDLNFSLLGVPVRIHPFFWLASLILGINLDQPKLVALWMLAVLLSILVHEFGHVMAFRACGVASRVVLHAFGGLAIADRGGYRDSYGPSSYGRDADTIEGWRRVFVSFAGPLAGFLFAGLIVAGLYAGGAVVPFFFLGEWRSVGRGEIMAMPNLLELVNFLLQANVWWGIINLFPVYPLDGGQISRELLLMRSPANGIRLSLQLSIFTAVILAVGAILQKHGMYMAVMFGFLAYSSYQNLKAYNDFGRYRGSDW